MLQGSKRDAKVFCVLFLCHAFLCSGLPDLLALAVIEKQVEIIQEPCDRDGEQLRNFPHGFNGIIVPPNFFIAGVCGAVYPSVLRHILLPQTLAVSVPAELVRRIVDLRGIGVLDVELFRLHQRVRLDKLETVNVKRCVDNARGSMEDHYFHAVRCVAERTPFFAKVCTIAHIKGLLSRCEWIVFSLYISVFSTFYRFVSYILC